jgi:nucleoside-diphosphate-sugar epimerase
MGRLRMFVNIDRAREELGFSPTSVEAAVGRSVAWYREHGHA